jgi:tetratricopeptide (TPR) repeat protein
MIVLAASLTASGEQTSAEDLNALVVRGTVVSRITCLDDPTQSYAVYLPSKYNPDRAWPIIYAFDPFARGKAAVDVYKDAAEKYGYIVVGSNNSKNGPSALQLGAAQAVWLDTHRRFAIDKNRVYTTGLSGGARVATSFALYCYTCAVAGVVAHGAGYPIMQSQKQPANDHFVYYAIVGDADLNYPEIMALRKKKDEAGAACKVKIYPGPHQWAPPEIVDGAVAWLELKAMQAGTEKTDSAFLQKMFETTQAEAAEAEQRGNALSQYYALRSLVQDFKGMEDTTQFESKLVQVRVSKALKNAERNQQREIEEQASLTATASAELAQFGVDTEAQAGLGQHIVKVMSDLRRQANSKSSDHLVGSRAFTQLLIQGMEAGQDALREGRFPQATAYFELMAEAAPDQAWPVLALAEAQVRAGNKKAALKALEQAVQRGVKHAATLTQDPELQPLASDPAFQRIVQGLSTQ